MTHVSSLPRPTAARVSKRCVTDTQKSPTDISAPAMIRVQTSHCNPNKMTHFEAIPTIMVQAILVKIALKTCHFTMIAIATFNVSGAAISQLKCSP